MLDLSGGSGFLGNLAVGGFKIIPGVGKQLAVGGVIRAFNAHDVRKHLRHTFGHVFHQFGLGTRRAGDEDLACICNSGGHFVKKMRVSNGMVRAQRQLVCLVCIEVKDAGLAMVDPDDGVKMRHGVSPVRETCVAPLRADGIDWDQARTAFSRSEDAPLMRTRARSSIIDRCPAREVAVRRRLRRYPRCRCSDLAPVGRADRQGHLVAIQMVRQGACTGIAAAAAG